MARGICSDPGQGAPGFGPAISRGRRLCRRNPSDLGARSEAREQGPFQSGPGDPALSPDRVSPDRHRNPIPYRQSLASRKPSTWSLSSTSSHCRGSRRSPSPMTRSTCWPWSHRRRCRTTQRNQSHRHARGQTGHDHDQAGPRDDTHESIRGHRHGRAGHVLCRSRAADGTQQSISTGTVLDVLPTFTIKLAMITIKQVRRMAP